MIQLPILPEQASRPWLKGDCDICPLSERVVRGWGVGGGIAVVGESPGRREVMKGVPFIGPSGDLLKSTLRKVGVDPLEEVYYTNAVLCHSDTKPEKAAILACNSRLQHTELPIVEPSKILIVGAAAAQALLSPNKAVPISKLRGKGFWYEINGRKVYSVATWHPAAVLREPDFYRDFSNDIAKLIANDKPDEDELEVVVCWTKEQAIENLTLIIENSTYMSCDIETTGFSILKDILLCIGFGLLYPDEHSGVSFIIPAFLMRHEEVKKLVFAILDKHPKVVFHNGKFDLKFLARDLEKKLRNPNIADSMLLHHLLDERAAGDGGLGGRAGSKMSVHGLKDLARFYCDADDYAYIKEFLKIKEPKKSDWEKLFYYCGQDAYYTARINLVLEKKAKSQKDFRGLELLHNHVIPASYALTEIEAHGMLMDRAYFEQFAQEKADVVNTIVTRLARTVEVSTHKYEWGSKGDPFNPASGFHVAELIYDVWKFPRQIDAYNRKNPRPVTKEVLLRLAALTSDPIQESILRDIVDRRSAFLLFKTYAAAYLRDMDEDDRIRPSFLLHGTLTGRLSCAKPNLQNVPNHIGPAVEWGFIASPGYKFVVADYSQIEIRILAMLSNDPQLEKIFAEGGDIHQETAVKLFRKNQISKLERQLTKTIVFGVIYGRGPESILKGKELQHLVEEQGIDPWTFDQAKAFQQEFLNTYPNIRKWLLGMEADAIKKHYVEHLNGRRRRFPLILAENRAEVLRQAGNSPIQGLASDTCVNAATILHDELNGIGYVLNLVHDSILFEIREDRLEEGLRIIRNSMEHKLPFETKIPFPVEIKLGSRWGDVEVAA